MRMDIYLEQESDQPLLPAEEQVDLAVEVFRMLADATRVRLLWVLLEGETPVNRMADAVAKPQATVSQHLAKLRMARLVQTRRQGTRLYTGSRRPRPSVDHRRDASFRARWAWHRLCPCSVTWSGRCLRWRR